MANPAPETQSSEPRRRYGRQLLALAVFVAVCVAILSLFAGFTASHIERNERAWLETQINALVPEQLHDNDLITDVVKVSAPEFLGTRQPVPVYRARLHGQPTAVVVNSVAPDGYGGPIVLLVAIDYGGKVLGVHVLAHHETPGMGDVFEQPGSTWLDAFRGRSLNDPDIRGWNVRKDGGDFEQFTSATISPRAIIRAVQKTLDYYQSHRDSLYRPTHDPASH